MILKNFWVWQKNIQYRGNSNITPTTGMVNNAGTAVTRLYGNTMYNRIIVPLDPFTTASAYDPTTHLYLVFGTGDTAPQSTDYALTNDCTASFTTIGYITTDFEDDKMEIKFDWTITNTTEDDITIKEIGVNKGIATGPSSATINEFILLIKEVLETPVTVEAGATKSISYVWTMQ